MCGGFAGFYETGGGVLYDYPCPDEMFQAFACEHFGWAFDGEDEND